MWVSALPRVSVPFGSLRDPQHPTCPLGPASFTTVNSHLARRLTHPVRTLHPPPTHLSWGMSSAAAPGTSGLRSALTATEFVQEDEIIQEALFLNWFRLRCDPWGSWGGCWSLSRLHVGKGSIHHQMNHQLILGPMWAFGVLVPCSVARWQRTDGVLYHPLLPVGLPCFVRTRTRTLHFSAPYRLSPSKKHNKN